jgi:hypothetical protein
VLPPLPPVHRSCATGSGARRALGHFSSTVHWPSRCWLETAKTTLSGFYGIHTAYGVPLGDCNALDEGEDRGLVHEQERQDSCVDAGHLLGLLWRWDCRRMSRICQSMASVKLEAVSPFPDRLCSVKLISGGISNRGSGSQVSGLFIYCGHSHRPPSVCPPSKHLYIHLPRNHCHLSDFMSESWPALLRFYPRRSRLLWSCRFECSTHCRPLTHFVVHREWFPGLTHIQ